MKYSIIDIMWFRKRFSHSVEYHINVTRDVDIFPLILPCRIYSFRNMETHQQFLVTAFGVSIIDVFHLTFYMPWVNVTVHSNKLTI